MNSEPRSGRVVVASLHGATAQVVDHDVGAGDEAIEPGTGLWVFGVDGERPLASVDGQEEGGLAVDERPEPPSQVTGRRLDLDHLGPQVGQQHPGVRNGDEIAELDDADPGQWPRIRCGHAASTTAAIPCPTPMHIVTSP